MDGDPHEGLPEELAETPTDADIPPRGSTVRASGEMERLPAEDDPAVLGEKDLFDDFEGEPTLAATDFERVGS